MHGHIDRIMANVEKNIVSHLTKTNTMTDNKLEQLGRGILILTDKLEQLVLHAPAIENDDNQNDDTKEDDFVFDANDNIDERATQGNITSEA
jgi:hypothetical protein